MLIIKKILATITEAASKTEQEKKQNPTKTIIRDFKTAITKKKTENIHSILKSCFTPTHYLAENALLSLKSTPIDITELNEELSKIPTTEIQNIPLFTLIKDECMDIQVTLQHNECEIQKKTKSQSDMLFKQDRIRDLRQTKKAIKKHCLKSIINQLVYGASLDIGIILAWGVSTNVTAGIGGTVGILHLWGIKGIAKAHRKITRKLITPFPKNTKQILTEALKKETPTKHRYIDSVVNNYLYQIKTCRLSIGNKRSQRDFESIMNDLKQGLKLAITKIELRDIIGDTIGQLCKIRNRQWKSSIDRNLTSIIKSLYTLKDNITH